MFHYTNWVTVTLSVGCTRQSCLFLMFAVIFFILHAQDYTARSSDVTVEGTEGVVTRQGDRSRVGYVLLIAGCECGVFYWAFFLSGCCMLFVFALCVTRVPSQKVKKGELGLHNDENMYNILFTSPSDPGYLFAYVLLQ